MALSCVWGALRSARRNDEWGIQGRHTALPCIGKCRTELTHYSLLYILFRTSVIPPRTSRNQNLTLGCLFWTHPPTTTRGCPKYTGTKVHKWGLIQPQAEFPV